MVSENGEEALSDLSCLAPWIRAARDNESMAWQPPSDDFRKVGLIIAARRQAALQPAFEISALVFSEGTEEIRVVLKDYATQGLAYLSEELRYDREHKATPDATLLRMRCAELALTRL